MYSCVCLLVRSPSRSFAHLARSFCSPHGLLSDPNMDPYYLGILVMVGANKSKFKPSVKAIKERYYTKFRGKDGEDLEEPEG